jgi:hypothetical protein
MCVCLCVLYCSLVYKELLWFVQKLQVDSIINLLLMSDKFIVDLNQEVSFFV